MPARFERHRRTKWEWGTSPSRSGEVRDATSTDPEPAKRAPRPKDTRQWCKGKTGREHQPATVLHSWRGRKCGWRETGEWVWTGLTPPPPKGVTLPKWPKHGQRKWVITGREWVCLHEYQCRVCGKFLGPVPECPSKTRVALCQGGTQP